MGSSRRQVFLLAVAQALFQSASVMVITVGGLAGAVIASRPEFATAPVASMFLGTATATIPASLWMAKVGRKTGFLTGALAGITGGLVAALGIWVGSLWVLAAGTFFVGIYQAFAQFYRFAAAEVSDAEFRPRAISLVLAGGVFAAIAGPLLGRYGQSLFQPLFIGSFLLLAAVSVIAALALLSISIPKVKPVEGAGGAQTRRLSEIVAQPNYLVALFGAVTGYGVMILAMTATPIAMHHHHHDLSDTAFVIQMHVLGMFLPSFFTGSLIARFGVVQIMLAGVILLAAHVLLTLTGTEFYSFLSALVLLGVGWNFLYVGGTTLLTAAYTPSESGRAQGVNDLTIFVVGLGCSLAAGALFHSIGWQLLNLLLLPWLALAAVALVWFAVTAKRTRSALIGCIIFFVALAGSDARAQFLWQTNSAGDDVHVYEVGDFRLLRRLQVGPNPHGIAAPDDGRVVFLSLEADGRPNGELLWLDPRNFEILHRLEVGPEPHALATTPDGKWVYIACRDEHYWVVDSERKLVVKKIRTGGRPHNVQASRDGRYMYLSPMEGKKSVFVVDILLGHEVVDLIAFPDSVRPSALSADGKLLLQQVDGLNGFIVADTTSRKILTTVRHSVSIGWFGPIKHLGFLTLDGFKRCHGLGIHPNQREVWSVCAKNLTIHRLEAPFFAEETAIKLPREGYWLTFSRDGRFGFVALVNGVAVIDALQRKIVRLLPAGNSPKRNLVIEY